MDAGIFYHPSSADFDLAFADGNLQPSFRYTFYTYLGQLFHKHKIGGAIISYFVLRFVIRIFRQLITLPISDVYLYYDTKSISSGTWILFMSVSLLATAGMCFAMYFICHYIITRKLNLD